MMDARSWLGRARSIEKEIDALDKARRETRDRLIKITQTYSDSRTQSSKDPHKFDRLTELEDLIDRKTAELLETKREITETIGRLQDGRQRTVLLDYYINCMSLEETAVHMSYSYANIKKIRARAISSIAMYIPGNCSLK